jgi:copper chaperone CopZ
MGLPFALLRPLAALVTALSGGTLANYVNKSDKTSTTESVEQCSCANDGKRTFAGKIRTAARYAYIEMMQDIGRWLVLGLIVAGLITVFVPDSFFSLFADRPFVSMLLVLLFAIPMYLCATGSIPIAVALMLKGLSPGTALVLLMAGPAVNVASLLVIGKVMGRKSLFTYIFSIVGCAILFGLGIDYLLPREWFTMPLAHIHECHGCSGVPYFNILCSILLAALLINAFVQRYRKSKENGCNCQACSIEPMSIIVKGMNCNHCKSNAEAAIIKVAGVESVEIDLASGRTVVHGSPNKEDVVKAVEALGFSLVED